MLKFRYTSRYPATNTILIMLIFDSQEAQMKGGLNNRGGGGASRTVPCRV